MSQQYDTAAKMVNAIVGCINKYKVSNSWHIEVLLYLSLVWIPHDKILYPVLGTIITGRILNRFRKRQERRLGNTGNIKSCEERLLKQRGMFHFVKRDLKRDMRMLFKYRERYHTKNPKSCFLVKFWKADSSWKWGKKIFTTTVWK